MKKNLIKNKIINHLTIQGKKKISEKILFKTFKELQKNSKKQTKELFKLSIISSSPIFKLNSFTNKKAKKKKRKVKEIPSFIKNKSIRTSLSIKFIIESANSLTTKNFFKKLKEEIMNSSKLNQTSAIRYKQNLQKQVLTKKHYLKYYRWN